MDKNNDYTEFILILINLFSIGPLFIWPAFLLVGAMLFDSPGSENQPLTLLIFYTILLYPIPVLIGFFGRRFIKDGKDDSESNFLLLVQIFPTAFFLLLLIFLQIVCNGSFSCN